MIGFFFVFLVGREIFCIRSESVTLTDNGRQATDFSFTSLGRLLQHVCTTSIYVLICCVCLSVCSCFSSRNTHQSMRSFSHAHSWLALCTYVVVFLGIKRFSVVLFFIIFFYFFRTKTHWILHVIVATSCSTCCLFLLFSSSFFTIPCYIPLYKLLCIARSILFGFEHTYVIHVYDAYDGIHRSATALHSERIVFFWQTCGQMGMSEQEVEKETGNCRDQTEWMHENAWICRIEEATKNNK